MVPMIDLGYYLTSILVQNNQSIYSRELMIVLLQPVPKLKGSLRLFQIHAKMT